MRSLKLNESFVVAKGNERICYRDPEDSTKIIKVPYKEKNSRMQNELEYKYYKYLEKKGVSFKHIAKCYGWVDVDGKKGLEFERVLNYDNTSAMTLNEAIRTGFFTAEQGLILLQNLQQYLLLNTIIFVDVSFDNIICKKQKDGSIISVIVDGLGGRRLGWKFWLYTHFEPYTKYKVKAQWKKILRHLEIALIEAESGKFKSSELN